MPGDSLHDFCKKKAFEVSYALFRVAGAISSKKTFSEHIEGQALELLRAAAAHDYRSASATLSAIEYFLRLGVEGGLVSPSNTQIIINEANNLNAAMIAAFGNAATVAELDLEGVFSNSDIPLRNGNEQSSIHDEQHTGEENEIEKANKVLEFVREKNTTVSVDIIPDSKGTDVVVGLSEKKQEPYSNSAIVAEYVTKMRQSTILDRVKELDNCRLRDIQEILPNISERTLRYDLQSLVEQGLIERIGSGGPGSYYRASRSSAQVA